MFRVTEINREAVSDGVELRADVVSELLPEPFRLWYRFPETAERFIDAESGDFLVAALLVPAMKTGDAVEIPRPMSPQLASALKWIQTVYRAWDPTLSFSEIRADLRCDGLAYGKGVGLFFSSGLDSLYALVKNTSDHYLNEDVIDTLIVIYGADIYLSDRKQHVFEQLLANARRAADHYGKQVLPVVTNITELLRALNVRRGYIGHGTTLFSVGLALQPLFRKIYIGQFHHYNQLGPGGTHPLLDPLWSTENTTFVVDGLEATRLEKTMFLSRDDFALSILRVCWAKESPEYNCGRCGKCLKTMLALHIAGALERSPTFPNSIDPELLRRVQLLTSFDAAGFFDELIDALGDSETDRGLKSTLEEGVQRNRVFFDKLERAKRTIGHTIPLNCQFIVPDQDGIRHQLGIGRKIIPFLEDQGPPKDDRGAIVELEKLRKAGARFMGFLWTDFWWLEHYKDFHKHLRSRYDVFLEDDTMLVFDLRRPRGSDERVDRI